MDGIRAIIILSLLMQCSQLSSQNARFSYLTSEDGISQSEVYCFLHDSKNYMWFGTLDGLNRYDGYTITTYKMDGEEPNSLVHSTVLALSEDEFGRIWIGTAEGLNVFDMQSQHIYTIPNFYSGRKLIIRTLLADNRNLWVGTQEGLFRLTIPVNELSEKRIANIVKTADHVDMELRGEKAIYTSILDITKTADKKIWIASWEGVSCFEFDPENKLHYRFADFTGPLNDVIEVNCIVEDQNKNIWIGTQGKGIYRYMPETGVLSNFKKTPDDTYISDNIKTMASDHQGNVWVGTYNNGLSKINAADLLSENLHFVTFQNNEFQPGSLNSNLIRDLYVSRDGLMWIGTIGKGINIYNLYHKKFSTIRIPPDTTGAVNNFIRSVYRDTEKNLWLGLHNGGLVKYDDGNKSFKTMYMNRFATIFHIHSCVNNYFWIATSLGAHIVAPEENQISTIASLNFEEAPDRVAYNACFNVEQSAQDIFWVASMSGIARVKINPGFNFDTEIYNLNSSPAMSFENTRVLLYDSIRNTLWAGTEGGGLNELILNAEQFPDTIIFHKDESGNIRSLSSNYVRSLCLDVNNDLYVGTYEGLNRFQWNEDSTAYDIQVWKTGNGLANSMVQSIESDDNGYLWLGTNGGLSRFDPVQEEFVNYHISDGLQSNEFSEHTSFKAPDGMLFFGGINGVNVFYPHQIERNPLLPKVAITDLYLFNKRVEVRQKTGNHIILEKSIDATDSLHLRSAENDIRFDFSALFFADPEKIKYTYILEGYDKNWINTDAAHRVANYTNLPFGNYIFKVKATNNDGTWNNDPTTLFIHISTPYYLKWWAITIYLILFVLLIWYFTRYSIIKITTKDRLVLENEHNQRLHELDVMRTKFFINISHDLRTPLTLITGPLEKVVHNFQLEPGLKHQLELVNRSAKRLKYLVEQLLDFRKAEAGKLTAQRSKVPLNQFMKKETEYFEGAIKEKGLELHVIHGKKEIEVCIDKDMMGKVIFNLMSNALKYTREGAIYVRVRIDIREKGNEQANQNENKWVVIEIEDSGSGISNEKSKKIFDRFYQDPENQIKGYGIGLSHSKDLVEAHQGRIEVSSIPENGTKFTIYLPMEFEAEQLVTCEYPDASNYHVIEPSIIEETVTETDEADLGPLETILVVEDTLDLREYIATNLKGIYNVIEASDGKEGLLKAKQFSPDLIISDIMMPIIDGIEFCRQIKTNIDTSHIPFVLLTARVDDETRFKGLETGADDYISKPFKMEYLILRVKNLLKTREHLRNLFQKNLDLEPSSITLTSADDAFLKKLMEIIESGIPDSEFSVESLEKEIGVSHTHFYRKIKSLTGQSGKELLQNMRLKRAAQLILQDKARISDVAYMTGFTNPKYFSKCFKAKYGVSPTEYKK